MEKFLGTVILILLCSVLLTIIAEMKDHNKVNREFTWQYNFKASLITFSAAAGFIWLMYLAVILITK